MSRSQSISLGDGRESQSLWKAHPNTDPFGECVTPKAEALLSVLAPREIEFRYLVPEPIFSKAVNSQAPKEIAQFYFPDDHINSLLKEFAIYARFSSTETFTSARIRSTGSPEGGYAFDIEFKGPKYEVQGLQIARVEVGISISKEQFIELARRATAGVVHKLRYEVAGAMQVGDSHVPLVAQVDRVNSAGIPPERLKQFYATVDIELSDERLIAPFCAGNHNFSFLSECTDMVTNGKKIRQHLSSSQIARHGLGKKQRAALAKALSKAPKASSEKDRPKK